MIYERSLLFVLCFVWQAWRGQSASLIGFYDLRDCIVLRALVYGGTAKVGKNKAKTRVAAEAAISVLKKI